jgi:hypothetical protein
MTPDQYHEILLGLDRVLDCFDRASVLMTSEDLKLQHELKVCRSKVLKAESGHPFPLKSDPASVQFDPEVTLAPWQIGYDPRSVDS